MPLLRNNTIIANTWCYAQPLMDSADNVDMPSTRHADEKKPYTIWPGHVLLRVARESSDVSNSLRADDGESSDIALPPSPPWGVCVDPGEDVGDYLSACASLIDRELPIPELFVLEFSSFADGRAFSQGRRIRQTLGDKVTLRARGKLIADQYPHALHCGFDEVDIDPEIYARQPLEQWIEAAGSISLHYQDTFRNNDRHRAIQRHRNQAHSSRAGPGESAK